MELKGNRLIAAEPGAVWAGLFDPEILMACVPGCTAFTGTPEAGYDVTVVQKLGPVRATFRGGLSVHDIDEPASVRIEAAGQGGLASLARGGATVRLRPEAGGTLVAYVLHAHVGGKLRKLGGEVIDGFGEKMAEGFFVRFEAALSGAEAGASPSGPEPAAPAAAKTGWFRRSRS